MMDREPAHGGVECSVRHRMAKGIAAEMRDALVQTAALRQINANRMQLWLQFKCSDIATGSVCKKARRAAYARADIEHLTRGSDPKPFSRGTYGIGAVIVPLVEGK